MSNPQLRKRAKLMLSQREQAIKKLNAARQSYEKMLRSHDPRKELKLPYECNKVKLCENSLNLIEGQLNFLRPARTEDIAYRNRQSKNFAEQIGRAVPSTLPLRFHGCPIYAAKEIIRSGCISSSVDRLGVGTSYDGTDQISVTTKDTIGLTLDSYSNLTNNYDLPAGCIFVVTPADPADELLGSHMMMGNVDFLKNHDRLVAVISTPENIPNLQSWLKDRGLFGEKAYDYDSFIASFEKVLASVRMSYGNFRDQSPVERKMSLDERIAQTKNKESSMNRTMVHEPGKSFSFKGFERS